MQNARQFVSLFTLNVTLYFVCDPSLYFVYSACNSSFKCSVMKKRRYTGRTFSDIWSLFTVLTRSTAYDYDHSFCSHISISIYITTRSVFISMGWIEGFSHTPLGEPILQNMESSTPASQTGQEGRRWRPKSLLVDLLLCCCVSRDVNIL